MGLIYLLAINGKPYIGQTKQTFEQRLKGHKKTSKNPNDSSYDLPLYRAIRKYGWEKLTPEIMENDIDDTELNDREIFYISLYDTMIPKGYNMTSGGNQLMVCSNETKEKMRITANKRYEDLDFHDKISLAAKKRFSDPKEREKARIRSINRTKGNSRKCEDTKNLPKYISIRRRASGVRYLIVDHPKCKFKYFGVGRDVENASQVSLNNCLSYLKQLNADEEIPEISESPKTLIEVDKVIKRKIMQKN